MKYKNKCIFLDRDGTINVYKELLHKKEDLELETHAAEAIRLINKSDFLCIVVTNQPVVARNLCSFQEAKKINERLKQMLAKKGAYLDDIFMCPHHPDKGYPEENPAFKIKCTCRKPDIGMILQAQQKHGIDLGKSYIIGDSTVDIQAGKNAGLKTLLVETGLGGLDKKFKIEPDYIAKDLYSAVNLIMQMEEMD